MNSLPPSGQSPQPCLVVVRPASGTATASLVLGILSTFMCCFTGLPAVICGHLSLSEIKKSGNMLEGKGMAIGGLVLGYMSLLPVLVYGSLMAAGFGLLIPSIISAQAESAHHEHAIYDRYAAARPVAVALRAYAVSHHNQLPPDLETLVREKAIHQSALTRLANDLPTWPTNAQFASQPPGWSYIGAGRRLPNADHLMVLESRFTNEDDRHLMMGLNGSGTTGTRV